MGENAGIYARISVDDGTAFGVTRQVADCRALAKHLKWKVREAYIDNDVSASNGKRRPQYERLLDDVRSGRLDAVIVWDVDRLTRNPREIEDILDLADSHGLDLASVGGDVDIATPQGRMIARIKGSVARHEAEQSARRIRAQQLDAAQRGLPPAARAFGWDRVDELDAVGRRIGPRDVINPERAALVREAAKRILAGETLRQVSLDWNRRAIPTNRGDFWHPGPLRKILINPRYAGIATWKGELLEGVARWDAILTRDQWQRCTALLTDPARRVAHDTAVKHLLSGIATCGVCGAVLRPHMSRKRMSISLVCSMSQCVARHESNLEAFVTSAVMARISDPKVLAAATGPEPADVELARSEVATLTQRLAAAADGYASGGVTLAQLERITANLKPKIEKATRELRAQTASSTLADFGGAQVASLWATMPLTTQRALLRTLLERVAVHPIGPGVRPQWTAKEVELVWR